MENNIEFKRDSAGGSDWYDVFLNGEYLTTIPCGDLPKQRCKELIEKVIKAAK
jgi:hypothetical protein